MGFSAGLKSKDDQNQTVSPRGLEGGGGRRKEVQFDGSTGEPVERDAELLISQTGDQNPDTTDTKAWICAALCGLMSANSDSWQDHTAHKLE